MKYYPHHIGDFNRATRHLTRIERSIYRDLIELYYETEQQLTHDTAFLCRKILARSAEEVAAVEQILNEFFSKTPTRWYHTRCESEIEKYKSNNSQKSQAGRASAASKALKKQQAINGCSTSVEQTNSNTPTNHQPVTINQEPMNTEADASLSPAKLPTCPQDELLDLYSKNLPHLPQPRKSLWKAGKNSAAMKARWRWVLTAKHESGKRSGMPMASSHDEAVAWFDRFFDYVAKSDFLNGKQNSWVCDLGWLVTQGNFEKVVTGVYQKKEISA